MRKRERERQKEVKAHLKFNVTAVVKIDATFAFERVCIFSFIELGFKEVRAQFGMSNADLLYFSHIIQSVRVNFILTFFRLIYAESVFSTVVPTPFVDSDTVKLKTLREHGHIVTCPIRVTLKLLKQNALLVSSKTFSTCLSLIIIILDLFRCFYFALVVLLIHINFTGQFHILFNQVIDHVLRLLWSRWNFFNTCDVYSTLECHLLLLVKSLGIPLKGTIFKIV